MRQKTICRQFIVVRGEKGFHSDSKDKGEEEGSHREQ